MEDNDSFSEWWGDIKNKVEEVKTKSKIKEKEEISQNHSKVVFG